MNKREGGDLENNGILRLCGEALTFQERRLWERKRQAIIKQNLLKMQSRTIKALNRACFYRGKVEIRIHFGNFTIRRAGWDTLDAAQIPLQQFFSDLDRHTPEGNLNHLLVLSK